jgi:hypothetical protein
MVKIDRPACARAMPTRSEIFGLDRLPTPIGVALLVTDSDGALRALDWEDYEPRMKELLRRQYGVVVCRMRDRRRPSGPPSQDISKAISIVWTPSNGASPARRSSARSGPRCQKFRPAAP